MIPAIAFMFSGLDAVFAASAMIGGTLFLLRMLLLLFGIGHGDDVSGLEVGHVDIGHADSGGSEISHHGDSEGGFRLFTVNGAMGFFMIFGLLGLALHRGSHLGEVTSILGGFIGGFAMMALLGWILLLMQGLASSGTIDNRNAVGQIGSVYLNIPENGTGQVEVCVQNRLRVMDAVADDHGAIKTGERVEVINLISGNTLVVRRC